MTKHILTFALCILHFPFANTASADEPVFARASFLIPPESREAFAADYREQVLPLLVGHGLKHSSEAPRASVDSVYTSLLEADSTAAIVDIRNALWEDDAWGNLMKTLRERYPTHGTGEELWTQLDVYRAPFGPGKLLSVGPGRTVTLPAESKAWRRFMPRDGLAGGKTHGIAQDLEGNLWLPSVGGGVSRFDGQTWTTFTTRDGLASNRVHDVVLDRDGRLWFSTNRGITVHTPSSKGGDAWVTYTVEDGLAHDVVLEAGFVDRSGMIWFPTRDGVSRYDPSSDTWMSLGTEEGLPASGVRGVYQDRAGRMWFGTGKGVTRYDPRSADSSTRWTTYGVIERRGRVEGFHEDAAGRMWVGTVQGVAVAEASGKRDLAWRMIRSDQGLFDGPVSDVFTDREGHTWIASAGLAGGGLRRGVLGPDLDKVVWSDPLFRERVPVTDIFEDREGNLWFGTDGAGVLRYDGRTWLSVGPSEGLADLAAWTLFTDVDGWMWVGTQHGISRLKGRTAQTWTREDGLPGDNVRSICQDRDGALWFATLHGGVLRYDGEEFIQYRARDGLAGNTTVVVGSDEAGRLWIGGWVAGRSGPSGGFVRLEGNTMTTLTRADGLVGQPRSFLSDRSGRIWIGTRGGGVAAGAEDEAVWPIVTYRTADGLPGNSVEALCQDRSGALWTATSAGLGRFDPSVAGTAAFTHYTKEDGLGENQVRAVYEDDKGRIWVGTLGGGVSLHDPSLSRGANGERPIFQTLTVADGLTNDAVYCITQDGNGDLWIATTGGGLSRYTPPKAVPPPVLIDAVVADRRHDPSSDVRLPSPVGLLSFEFHGISLRNRADGLLYRYRLEGYDADWQTTRSRRVEYNDVPQGAYRFEVEAIDRDLVVSKAPAVLALTVYFPMERVGLWSGLAIAIVLIGWQTARVIRRDKRLRLSNEALSAANHQLFDVNKALQRDRAVERIRAEVQSMDEADDFEKILSVLTGPEGGRAGVPVVRDRRAL